jgi:hypothetical protein
MLRVEQCVGLLQRRSDGLDLQARLLTESDRRQLELIAVLPDRARS